jgi:signal transduction histidine kinase
MLALQRARRTAETDGISEPVRNDLDVAVKETAEAVRELRELARGIHPAILEDEGLGAAIAALARRAGIPVEVRFELDDRLPRLVESTSYFTIAEALTNTQRHARASHATVRVAHTGDVLHIEVSDDGIGGAAPDRGSGLRGLADRVTAIGGRLEVDSRTDRGTRLTATIPTR